MSMLLHGIILIWCDFIVIILNKEREGVVG